jgi:DNA-binding MarR family transcriptional regulator
MMIKDVIIIIFDFGMKKETARHTSPVVPPRLKPPQMVNFGRIVPPVRRVPLPLARRFFQICMTVSAAGLEGSGLTPLEFAILAYVTKDGGEPDIDQTSLAQQIGIDRNNMSLLIERLVSHGLIDRRENGQDRRARMLRLTPAGEKLFQKLLPDAVASQQRILAPLKPAQRELLLDLLVQVIEANLAFARPGAGRRKRGSSSDSTSANSLR